MDTNTLHSLTLLGTRMQLASSIATVLCACRFVTFERESSVEQVFQVSPETD